MPAEFFFRLCGLQSKADEHNVPSSSHLVYYVYDGTRRLNSYESLERAIEALRTEFEKQHPGVPFTPENALHGTDEQGNTLWSFAIVSERIDGPSRREVLEQAWKDDALRQKLEYRKEHPRKKLELVGEEGAHTPDDVLRVAAATAVKRHLDKVRSPWPDPDEFDGDVTAYAQHVAETIDVRKTPFVSENQFLENLQAILSGGAESEAQRSTNRPPASRCNPRLSGCSRWE